MNLMPTKIELIHLEVHEIHVLVRLLLSADKISAFEVTHLDIIDILIMIENKFENLDKKFEEINHEDKS